MKIKALKSGKFAHPDPAKSIIELVKGETYEVDHSMAESLAGCFWGKPVQIKKPKKAKKNGE